MLSLVPIRTLPPASCRADAVAPHDDKAHPDEVRGRILDLRLEPGTGGRRALGLCIRSGTCAAAGAFLQVSGGW